MSKINIIKPFAIIALLSFLSACGEQAQTQNTAVHTRQNLMQDWRIASDIMKGMLENPDAFDVDTFKEQVEFINNGTDTMWASFTDNSAKGNAQDAVWSNATDFQMKQDNFTNALSQLLTATETATNAGDVEQAFGALSEACGACHKVYKR